MDGKDSGPMVRNTVLVRQCCFLRMLILYLFGGSTSQEITSQDVCISAQWGKGGRKENQQFCTVSWEVQYLQAKHCRQGADRKVSNSRTHYINCSFADGSMGQGKRESGGRVCNLSWMEPCQVHTCWKLKIDLDTMHASLYSGPEKMLIAQWTDSVAKDNTLTLTDDQYLVQKYFTLVEYEEKPTHKS